MNILNNTLVNFSIDSVYVTVTNYTHGEFSLPKTGLAPQTNPSSGNISAELKAIDGDELSTQCTVKSVNKTLKHPFFIKEFTYSYTQTAPDHGTVVGIDIPRNNYNIISIFARNSTDSYVTAMLVYNGKEDSLFTLEPLFGTTGTTSSRIGFINAADTSLIKNPMLKVYFGRTPPFTSRLYSVPLWGEGTNYISSSSEPYTLADPSLGWSSITIPIKQ